MASRIGYSSFLMMSTSGTVAAPIKMPRIQKYVSSSSKILQREILETIAAYPAIKWPVLKIPFTWILKVSFLNWKSNLAIFLCVTFVIIVVVAVVVVVVVVVPDVLFTRTLSTTLLRFRL